MARAKIGLMRLLALCALFLGAAFVAAAGSVAQASPAGHPTVCSIAPQGVGSNSHCTASVGDNDDKKGTWQKKPDHNGAHIVICRDPKQGADNSDDKCKLHKPPYCKPGDHNGLVLERDNDGKWQCMPCPKGHKPPKPPAPQPPSNTNTNTNTNTVIVNNVVQPPSSSWHNSSSTTAAFDTGVDGPQGSGHHNDGFLVAGITFIGAAGLGGVVLYSKRRREGVATAA